MTIIINPVPLPPFGGQTYNQITPFTYRDGLTYVEVLESLRAYIRDILVPLVNEGFDDAEDYVNGAVAELTQFTTTAIAENKTWTEEQISTLTTYVNSTVQQIIGSSVEVQDPVVAGILADTDSESRTYANSIFADKATQETVTTGRLSETQLRVTIAEAMDVAGPAEFTLGAWEPGSRVHPLTADRSALNVYGSSSERRIQDALPTLIPSSWDMTVNKFAFGGETIEDTLARTGVAPARITFAGNTIPASGTVNLTETTFNAISSNLATYRVAVTADNGTVVEGTIARVSEGVYSFTRTPAGAALTTTGPKVAAPTLANGGTAQPPSKWDKVAILSGAKNNLSESDVVGKQAAAITALYNALVPSRPLAVMLGLFNNRWSSAANKSKIAAINEWREAFASTRDNVVYVSMQEYVTSNDVWTDTGITPTSADLERQASGELPASISDDSQHMNNDGTNAFVQHRLLPALAELVGRTYNPPGTWYAVTSDSFNRANSPTLSGQSTDAANGGSSMGYESFRLDAWGIETNRLIVGTPQNSFLAVATSGDDQRISVDYVTLPTGGETYLNVRRSGLNPAGANSYRVRVHSSGSLTVQRVDAGVVVDLHAGISDAVAPGDTVTLEVVGATVRALVNGVQAFTGIDNTYASGGFTGISAVAGMTAVELDDLLYEQIA